MEITFLVGNGFNASLGLKTSYSNFYAYLNRLMSSEEAKLKDNTIIDNIHAEFNNSNNKNAQEKRWSDLEVGLGEFTAKCKCTPEEFLEQKYEIDNLLVEFLSEEQSKFNMDEFNEKELEKYANIFRNSLVKFSDFFPPEDKAIIANTIASYGGSTKYNIIDFNYTYCVDDIWDTTLLKLGDNSRAYSSFGTKIHVHGELGLSPILGVDNVEQIANTEWRQNSSFVEMIVKEKMNKITKQDRTNQARAIIKNSAIIIVYGMSLGKTDQLWWKEIANWLVSNDKHKLIIYAHCNNRDDLIRSVYKKRKTENEYWNSFRDHTSIDEKKWQSIRNNIFIQNSALIFDFPEIIPNK